MPVSYRLEDLSPATGDWEHLPFRFERLDDDRVVVTNLSGEHALLSGAEFAAFADGSLDPTTPAFRRLRGKHLLRLSGETLPVELLGMKLRTRYRRLSQLTSLHIFVITLRCDHGCRYCQVSRQKADKVAFDMSAEHARRALEVTFQSPSPAIKIEFQGGEPLLNWPLIEQIVLDAEAMNQSAGKDLAFVIATNLALLNDDILAFAAEHSILFSTSLDGPAALHNSNRPRPGGDSWERTIAGVNRIRTALGPDRVGALMTTTEASLSQSQAIIDAYLEQGFTEIFLRPLSPYGFAIKTKTHAAYDTARWLAFYEAGLDYILELNAAGVPMIERLAAIILRKMLTNDDPGYVDLTSPAGIGIGALVYNYDGGVYASDEGRMLAEMGDDTFRIGHLDTATYHGLLTSDVLLDALEDSFAASAPMCSDCAFEPWCGADPVFHHATTGDHVGHKPTSAFHQRNDGLFRLLLDRYERDPQARSVFQRWVTR